MTHFNQKGGPKKNNQQQQPSKADYFGLQRPLEQSRNQQERLHLTGSSTNNSLSTPTTLQANNTMHTEQKAPSKEVVFQSVASKNLLLAKDNNKSNSTVLLPPPPSQPPASNVVIIQQNYTTTTKSSSFREDLVCGGCRTKEFGRVASTRSCGTKLRKIQKKDNLTLSESLVLLLTNASQSEDYYVCRDYCTSCPDHQRRYWRYDHVAPPILHSQTHYLSSIPSRFRVPASVVEVDSNTKLTQYLDNTENNNTMNTRVFPYTRYVFEYNPSIVIIPPNQRQYAPKGAVYLASYRVSSRQSCFADENTLQMLGGDWNNKKKNQKNWLGLAFLRHDLSILVDAVLSPNLKKYQDFRLFALPTQTKGKEQLQLYLATYCTIYPFWLSVPPSKSPTDYTILPRAKGFLGERNRDNLTFVMGTTPTMCSNLKQVRSHGKNLNYFVDPTTTTTTTMDDDDQVVVQVEIAPVGSSKPTKQGDLFSYRQVQQLDLTSHTIQNYTLDDHIPSPNFYSMHELDLAYKSDYFFYPFTVDRGSACCVQVTHPQNTTQPLLLGISHVKTPFGRIKTDRVVAANSYLSRFYAFEPHPPYRLVALSGFFCLGNSPLTSQQQQQQQPSKNRNPYVRAIHSANQALHIGDEKFECHRIHFVSGMTKKFNDTSKLIIAYGIGDCIPRFIEIRISDALDLLFSQPKPRE